MSRPGSFERIRFHVADDANNRAPGILGLESSDLQAFPDRVLVGPIAARQCLIDDGDLHGLVVIGFGESSSGYERDLEHAEMVRSDGRKFGNWFSFGIRGTALNRKNTFVSEGHERQAPAAADGGRFHSGQRGNPAQDFAMKFRALRNRPVRVFIRIVRNANPDLGRDDMLRIKAGPDLEKLPKATEEEPGADQKDERESDFGSDEHARDPKLRFARTGPVAAFAQARDLVRVCGLERRSEAEQDSRDNRNCKSKEQDAGTDADFMDSRQIRGSKSEKSAL